MYIHQEITLTGESLVDLFKGRESTPIPEVIRTWVDDLQLWLKKC